MIETLQKYKDTFIALPLLLQLLIVVLIFVVLPSGVYFGFRTTVQEIQIRKLESENRKLTHQANDFIEKTKRAEQRANDEAARAQNLEEKVAGLETQARELETKIYDSQNNSKHLRNDLLRVRTSQPANIGTEQLERRLCQRYSNCK